MNDYFNSIWGVSKSDQDIQEHVKTHFMSLAGVDLDYYGADSGDCTFNIDGIVFKVLEDPDDGYRSHLGPIDYSGTHSSIFFDKPIAKVRIEEFEDEDEDGAEWSRHATHGYRLVDALDKHIWLEFGTGNHDDYYPYFMFRHYPKEKRRSLI